jgi:hypothetical protein
MSLPIHHPTGHQRQRAEVFEELQPGAAGTQPAEEGGRSVGYRRRRQVSTLKTSIPSLLTLRRNTLECLFLESFFRLVLYL